MMTTNEDMKNHPHTKNDGSWWENDARGIPLCRVCSLCRKAKLSKYRPEILTGFAQKRDFRVFYDQSDVDEPIEPEE